MEQGVLVSEIENLRQMPIKFKKLNHSFRPKNVKILNENWRFEYDFLSCLQKHQKNVKFCIRKAQKILKICQKHY